MSKANESAERWLPAAQAGSLEALGHALEACRGYLTLIARRELAPELLPKVAASDLVQQTLLEAFEDFSRFQGHTEEELRQWLRRMLLNNLLDWTRHYRDTARRDLGRESPLDEATESAEGAQLEAALPSPSDVAVHREETDLVQGILRKLPECYRQVILWRYQDGRSFDQIGQALGMSANAARKLLVRAIVRVQQELGEVS